MSSPFLALPWEIRIEIYRNLLLTSRISLDDFPLESRRLGLAVHTAILLVNQQISEEAAMILYQENDFVWVHRDFVSVPRHGWAFNCSLRRFRGDQAVEIQPVLNIMVNTLDTTDEKPGPNDQDLYWLTTFDSLSSFCESVHVIDTPYPWLVHLEAPLDNLSLTLELFDEMPTKKSRILDLLQLYLNPFRFLHGFGEFFVTGVVDKELSGLLQDVWHHIKRGPCEEIAKNFMETCDKRSKEKYVLRQYRTAKAYCTSLVPYRNYLRILLDSGYYSFDYTLLGLISKTWKIAMEAGLRNVKSSLRLRDTITAKLESWNNHC